MNIKKDVLKMSDLEFYNNRKSLTDDEKIRWKTSARKDLSNFPDNDVFICDALSLVPKKKYNISIILISQSSEKEMSAIVRIPHGKGEISVGESKSKGGVFWFSEEYKKFYFTVKTNYGRILILHALKEFDHRGQKIMLEMGNGMGMKIEEISENKKIYHCTDYGLPVDFEKLVFSVEWNMFEE